MANKVSIKKYKTAMTLVIEGLADIEIERRTGIHRNTVSLYRRGHNIPNNRDATVERKEHELAFALRRLTAAEKRQQECRAALLLAMQAEQEAVADADRIRSELIPLREKAEATRIKFANERDDRRRRKEDTDTLAASAVSLARQGADLRTITSSLSIDAEFVRRHCDSAGIKLPLARPGRSRIRPTAHLASTKARYDAAVAANLCISCEHMPAAQDSTRCLICLTAVRERARRAAKQRRSSGLCQVCGNPSTAYRCWKCNEKRKTKRRQHTAILGASAS